jgi:large subunit ribosomal protein L22
MGKPKAKRPLADNEALAKGNRLRISWQKLNLVAQLIRGKKADQAVHVLQFSRKRIARDVKKVLESAIANAENNHGLDVDKLYVKEAFVGPALVMKRFVAKSKGRAGRVIKPYSNITVIVHEPPAKAEAKEAA